MDVRLGLRAVAEDLEAGWIALQLQDEIVNHSVRRKAAYDVAEAKDPALHLVTGGERGDERLAGDLTGGVKRNREERSVILRRGQNGGLAIDRAAAGENELLRPRHAHGFKQVVGDDRAAFEVEVGVARAEADVAVGGEMPDQLRLQTLEEGHDAI